MGRQRPAGGELLILGAVGLLAIAGVLCLVRLVDCPDGGPLEHAYLEQLARERVDPPLPRKDPHCSRCGDARNITPLNRCLGSPR